LSETCRVSFRNKFEKLVHLVGFIIKKEMGQFGYRIDGPVFASRQERTAFSPLPKFQAALGAHLASHSIDIGVLYRD
jgi:hypothetical protein